MNADDQTPGAETRPSAKSSTGLSGLDFGETKTVEQYAMLAERFVFFADTLVGDYDVVELVDGLVATSVELLDVTAAGLLLLDGSGKLQPIASSSEDARMLELFQLQNEEGPCLESVSTGQVVSVPDLEEAVERWPRFSRAALERGFHSVHAVPLRPRDEHIGGLNLFSARQPPISQASRRVIQALADVATIGILQQRSLNGTTLLAEQLQSALNSRVFIEQAKGVLAESGKTDMGRAFQALRSYARSSNQRLSSVAQQLVSRSLDPESVLRGWDPRS
jgi:GAF domain-containing protein